MKRFLLFFLLSTSLGAQQELGTYFMQGLHQSSELNPSFDADAKLVVSLPSGFASLHQRGLSIKSLLQGRLVGDFGGNGDQVMLGSNFSVLKLSHKHENVRYNFAHNFRSFTDFQSGTPLLTLIAQGNAPVIGGSVEFSPNFQYVSFSETVFGIAVVGDFSIGANMKILNGIQNISSATSAFELSVSDDIYQLELNSSFLLNSSFPIDLNSLPSLNLFRGDLIPKNFGVAFDVGASYNTGLFNISASILDVGYLRWNDQPHNYDAEGSFVYAGITVQDILEADFDLLDSLVSAIDFNEGQGSYRNFVPAKFYVNLNYDLAKNLQVGALFYGHRNYGRTNAALALNMQRKWRNRHAVSAQYAVIGAQPFNLGLSGYTTVGPMQLYGVFDNVIGLIQGLNAKNASLRVGVNLVFGQERSVLPSGYGLLD